MKIFVTGGAGFIGSHIAEYHLRKGDEVWAIDNLETGNLDNLECLRTNPRFHFKDSSVADFTDLCEVIQWSDKIYHAAATVGMQNVLVRPTYTLSNNLHSLESLLKGMEKAGNRQKFLFLSSSGVYWNTPLSFGVGHKEDEILGVDTTNFVQEAYSLSKMVGEVLSLSFAKNHHIHCVVARVFNTVGVRQTGEYGMVVPRFVRQALVNEPITIYGTGEQTRSFCSVHDTVRALDLLLDHPKAAGQIFNVGNERETTILELASIVKKLCNSSSEIIYIPYKEAYQMEFRDVLRRRPDMTKFYHLTGFKAEWSLEETIQEMI
ncbi:MAG: NAD-dependent epimerase/dehydratase family protein [Chlamydiales bacterium]